MSGLIVLLAVIGIGLLIGRITIAGISLGTSAILFVALAAGHRGATIPSGVGELGMAFFVYCVGISAGPTFFRGLASQGRVMAILGGIIVLAGMGITWLAANLLDLPSDLAGGLMAGAMTSTPALGAASEVASDASVVAVGFGVAYPIGVVAVVLVVQIGCRMLRRQIEAESQDLTSTRIATIQRTVIEIANPMMVGRAIHDIDLFTELNCQVSRIRVDDRWRPIPRDHRFELGQQVMVVGQENATRQVAQALGILCSDEVAILDADHERKTVVVTSTDIYGKTLKELGLRSNHGVTVVRIRRHEMEFVPSGHTRIEFGDNLVVVGEPQSLSKIEQVVGHRPRVMNETDLLSLVFGIGAGLLLGQVSVSIGSMSISLGLAGGPLVVGLLLGHFRRIGPIRGSFPPAAQLLMTEGGLALFLADSGIHAGSGLEAILAQYGVKLAVVAAVIAVVPMLVGYALARYGFKLSVYQSLGATCGGMTSTPGLAVLTTTTDSSQPVTSYVAAYPIALVAMTVLSRLLVEVMR